MKTNSKKTLVEKFISKGWKLASEERPEKGMSVLTALILKRFDGKYFITYNLEFVSDFIDRHTGACDITKPWMFGDAVTLLWKKVNVPVESLTLADDSFIELMKKGGIK